MSSEKSRYLFKGIPAPLSCDELKLHLPSLGINRLVEIIWLSSQNNMKLYKALMGSIGIQLANGNLEKAKQAIDYALEVPDYIKYNQHGYGLILDEIKTTLEQLLDASCNKEYIVTLARYVTINAQKLIENFDDDWDWVSSLKPFEEWLQTIDN